MNTKARDYLNSIRPSGEMIDHFTQESPERHDELEKVMCNNAHSTFDAELGWVLRSGIRAGSVDGSKGVFVYEADGARRVINSRDRPCRIHTYGDSFTHCDQVSDGETWQEFLAAHLQEPIRNFGIGGFSVYQAYRRMRLIESDGGAEYVILNIYDDDHFRNLDSWRSIRKGNIGRFTLPHLKVDLENATVTEVDNPCRTREDVYRLLDPDYIWETFKDDAVLQAALARQSEGEDRVTLNSAAARAFGRSGSALANAESDAQLNELCTDAALFASQYVVEQAKSFLEKRGKKLMLLLTFSRSTIVADLEGKPRFDQTFLDWLKGQEFPWFDARTVFREDFASYKGSINEFLDRYYIGHHTPAGNFLMAWAIKDLVCSWLDPKPLPYL